MAHVLISASHKSSGKTTLSVGLAAALASKGLAVQTFKKGPDYIDPMWLSGASGRPCYNLDFNTQEPDEIRRTFALKGAGADICLTEGNMGLHDGVDLAGSDSTAALAALLGSPVILVIDCEGMTRGVAPLLLGFQSFDSRIKIAGVILNRVATSRQETKLVGAVERYTNIRVLGALRRDTRLSILERHLGLSTPSDCDGEAAKIRALGETVAAHVDLDHLLEIARTAQSLAPVAEPGHCQPSRREQSDVVIAVARDAAFGFYYPDDLEALERAGARLEMFSPLADAMPPRADGFFLGGGFPEVHMSALEANAGMRHAIRALAERGTPIYAECGGLMYLARSIRWGEECRQMAGVIEADVEMDVRPQGRGLMVVEPTGDCPWFGGVPDGGSERGIRAHEFHHARLVNIAAGTRFAWRVKRGHGIDGHNDGIVRDAVLATFVHQRSTSRNRWAESFVEFVRRKKAERAGHSVARCKDITADRSDPSAITIAGE